MNFIKSLQNDSKIKDNTIIAATEGLNSLLSYLSSPKFYDDTTVQVGDVICRIKEIKSAMLDAENTRVEVK